ncbi:MAG: hypothetical protein AAF438_07350 [Pseudomonadota bacterium]
MSLPLVLRIVGTLIVIMVVGEYFVLKELLIPPLVIVAVLFALSFAYSKWPKTVTGITIVMCILVPIAAINGYLRGQLVLLVPIFDVVIFSWLLWTAVQSLRSNKMQRT